MLIFFDVDGTLLNDQGFISTTTKKALSELKKRGHQIFLATGRSKADLSGEILAMGFHGLVLSSGAYVEYGEHEIWRTTMNHERVLSLAEELTQGNAFIIYGASDTCYVTQKSKVFFRKLYERLFSNIEFIEDIEKNYTIINDLKDIGLIEKLVFFEYQDSVKALAAKYADYFYFSQNNLVNTDDAKNGEVTIAGIDKASGIRYILNHLGESREMVISFGDGYNDIEMIQFSKIGVAMGNAITSLKQEADLVTTDVNADGVYHGLRQLGLIFEE